MPARGASILLAVALACGCRPGRDGSRSPGRPDPDPQCAPYLESTGATLQMPPAAFLHIAQGTPLVVTSMRRGFVEVGVDPASEYRGYAFFHGVFVWLDDRVRLSESIDALPGARAPFVRFVRGEEDSSGLRTSDLIEVLAPDGYRHDPVPCLAVARAPMPAPVRPKIDRPRWLTASTTMFDPDREPLFALSTEDVVELVATHGQAARVRVWWEGYLFTGWIPSVWLATEPSDEASLLGDGPHTSMSLIFGGEPSPIESRSPGAPCSGAARLRAGSAMWTGPTEDPSPSPVAMPRRQLPALDHDIEVELDRSLADDRRVVVPSPAPDIESITIWVRADALDRETCVE